jgi:hypothetical protein
MAMIVHDMLRAVLLTMIKEASQLFSSGAVLGAEIAEIDRALVDVNSQLLKPGLGVLQ